MQTKSKPLNKRKRGRPRKTHIPNTSSLQQEVDEQQIVSSEAISQNPCEPRSFHAKSNLQNPKQPKEVGVLRSQLVYMPIESEEEVQIEEYSSLEIAEQVSNYLQGYTTVGKGPLFEIFDPRSQVTRFLKSCEDSESLLPKSEILRLAHLVQQWAFPDVGNFTDDLPIYDHQNEQEHSVQSQENLNSESQVVINNTATQYSNLQPMHGRALLRHYRNITHQTEWSRINELVQHNNKQHIDVTSISRLLGISRYHVQRLLKLDSKQPDLLVPQKRGRKQLYLSEDVKACICETIENDQGIITTRKIMNKLKQQLDEQLSQYRISQFLKKEMHMRYHKISHLTPNHNNLKSLLQRQIASAYFIQASCSAFTIYNIDETIIQNTDCRSYSWISGKKQNVESSQRRVSRLCITAAASNMGTFMFNVSVGYTNSHTFLAFIMDIVEHLDNQEQDWRSHSLLLMDNASYHRSSYTNSVLQKLNVPILFLGPYQYDMAPVEKAFRFIKCRDLNPMLLPVSTKKQLRRYAQALAVQLSNLDMRWLTGAFACSLVDALKHLSLQAV